MTNSLRRDDPKTDRSEEPGRPNTDEPAWFFEGANQPTREELIARYRKHFNLPENGAPAALLPRAGNAMPGYRDLIAAPRNAGRLQVPISLSEGDALGPAYREAARHGSMDLHRTYVLAALGAMLAGGSVGFLASQAHVIKEKTLAVLSTAVPDSTSKKNSAVARIPGTSVALKKPVATASLQVEDAAGQVDSLIPLVLRAEPAEGAKDLLLKLSGLPDKAYLTSGHKQADKAWTLSLADLENVKLMVPAPGQPEINVAVAAFERGSGELAAPVKTMTIALSDAVIVPVASPALQPRFAEATSDLPSPIPVPMNLGVTLASLRSVPQDLIAMGDVKLKSGDMPAARQLYERAWSNGAAEGAMSLARTFDSLALAQLHITGAAADREQALRWYERAAHAGKPGALAAIARLKAKP